jgi:hypothetical protein
MAPLSHPLLFRFVALAGWINLAGASSTVAWSRVTNAIKDTQERKSKYLLRRGRLKTPLRPREQAFVDEYLVNGNLMTDEDLETLTKLY